MSDLERGATDGWLVRETNARGDLYLVLLPGCRVRHFERASKARRWAAERGYPNLVERYQSGPDPHRASPHTGNVSIRRGR